MTSRRRFLANSSIGWLAAAATTRLQALPSEGGAAPPPSPPPTPGSPPVWTAAPAAGPAVSEATFEAAERLMQVSMTAPERTMAAQSWGSTMAPLMERRSGPRSLAIPRAAVPASLWFPAGPASPAGTRRAKFVPSSAPTPPLPKRDEDIAYAPVTALSHWIKAGQLRSQRLTEIYLERIRGFDARLRSFITVAEAHALAQARQADVEIAAGRYRGPLHGVPYGVKDLLDTAGIRTTWGAEPFQDRVPTEDAAVVRRLNDAGAVLLGKLSLGALALNDIWFGGQTMNPWLPEHEGASGSSAGPGAATAAALVAFSIGSETGGSIVSPSMRCGVAGLRPTFGRVARSGAMTLSWSLDKLGPMTRSSEDAILVLKAITGADPGDPYSVDAPLGFDARGAVKGLRVGYFERWMQEDPATEVDRAALRVAGELGMQLVPVRLPDWPYQCLDTILFAESAASFESLTLGRGIDALRMQVPDAWPNMFRLSRFLSAVDLVQADRMRSMVAMEMARLMKEVDLLIVPSLRPEMLTISNQTGHPSLTVRTGFVEVSAPRSDWATTGTPVQLQTPRKVPHGVTLIGRLFEEGTLARVGMALEQASGIAAARPPEF